MSTPNKEFTMTHVFEDVPGVKRSKKYIDYSEKEEHFGILWYLLLEENKSKAGLYLYLSEPEDTTNFSVEAEFQMSFIGSNGNREKETATHTFESGVNNSGFEYITWKTLVKDYVIDGELKVEVHVKILNMTGTKNKKLRCFDESMKDFSDIVLVAGDEKFYISKLFLASHSSYFKALLLGNFKESKKSEVVLKDIDPEHFQKFLEVLHGEDAINDKSVEGIVHLADMYDAPTAHRRCEQFLMKDSKKSLKEKLELSAKYKMVRVKNKCLFKIETVDDIKSVVPENIDEMDPSLAAAILKKAMIHL